MFNTFKAIKGVLKQKNALISAQRESLRAAECENRILTAYIAVLAGEFDSVYVPKAKIREALGKHFASVASNETDYIITLKRDGENILGKGDSGVKE